MVNAARKGRRFEYKVRDQLRGEGFVVIRSAASKTPVDLVAISPTGTIYLIQCSKTRKSEAERKAFKTFVSGAIAIAAMYWEDPEGKLVWEYIQTK